MKRIALALLAVISTAGLIAALRWLYYWKLLERARNKLYKLDELRCHKKTRHIKRKIRQLRRMSKRINSVACKSQPGPLQVEASEVMRRIYVAAA